MAEGHPVHWSCNDDGEIRHATAGPMSDGMSQLKVQDAPQGRRQVGSISSMLSVSGTVYCGGDAPTSV